MLETGLAYGAWNAGDREESRRHGEAAAALVRKRPASSAKAYVLAFSARRAFLLGEGDRGVGEAQAALAAAEEIGDEREVADALVTLGSALVAVGEPDRGLATLEEGITRAGRRHPVEAVRGLNNLSSYLASFGRLEEARAGRERALAESERAGVAFFARWARVELHFHDYWGGDWEGAASTALEVIRRAETGDRHYMDVGAYWTRSALALARGADEAAREDADRCLAFARESGDPQVLLPLLGWHAFVLAETGHVEEAVGEAVEVLETGGFDTLEFWAPRVAAALLTGGRGELFLAAPLPPDPMRPWWDASAALAAGDARSGADRFRAIGSLPDEAWARLAGGRALVAQGQRERATAELERALAFWRAVGATRYVREAELLLAGDESAQAVT
jgi:tetratricopeptide (TPR) repeat protein